MNEVLTNEDKYLCPFCKQYDTVFNFTWGMHVHGPEYTSPIKGPT